jgi:hypothetical protein
LRIPMAPANRPTFVAHTFCSEPAPLVVPTHAPHRSDPHPSSFRPTRLVVPTHTPRRSEPAFLVTPSPLFSSFRAEGEESRPLATPRSLPRLSAGVGMTAPRHSEALLPSSFVIPSPPSSSFPAHLACHSELTFDFFPSPRSSPFQAHLPRHSERPFLFIPSAHSSSFRAHLPRHSEPKARNPARSQRRGPSVGSAPGSE